LARRIATAKAFAESGASVALADWNEDTVRAAADELTAQGHKAIAIRCDVACDAQVEAMVKQTVAAFGRLDAGYNNAGVQNVLAETADTTREDYDRVMGINLRGEWSSAQRPARRAVGFDILRLARATPAIFIRFWLTTTPALPGPAAQSPRAKAGER
jgi:NAD(P)-dependent dehydrogenase (short-subunit alcohol dehydrogenase family)